MNAAVVLSRYRLGTNGKLDGIFLRRLAKWFWRVVRPNPQETVRKSILLYLCNDNPISQLLIHSLISSQSDSVAQSTKSGTTRGRAMVSRTRQHWCRRRSSIRLAMNRIVMCVASGLLAMGVGGCNTDGVGVAGLDSPPSATVQEPAEVKYYPSDEPLKLGLEHFERGNFGLSERYCRDAVEKASGDVTAWICLAASYDRVRRFDLADKAYSAAIKRVGETVPILNNLGYSYMLRGDLVRARAKFLKAYELEPQNPIVVNNLALLNSSSRYIQRAPEP
jgi:tetratricopeptide (TPR) repeat protein